MKKAMLFGAAALGAAAMGRRGQRSRKILLAMQGLPNQGRRDEIRDVLARQSSRCLDNRADREAVIKALRGLPARPYPYVDVRRVVEAHEALCLDDEEDRETLRRALYKQGLPNQGRRAAHMDSWLRKEGRDHVETVNGVPIYHDWEHDQYIVAIDPSKQSTWEYARTKRDARKMAKGRRAERRRTYKTLAGLSRAMGDRTLSLDEIHSQRAYLKGKGWSPIKYTLTYSDAYDIADALGGQYKTRLAVRNGLLGGRIGDLPYSTRQRIVWDKTYPLKNGGWYYVAGQDYRAETARIRNILKK